MKYVRYGTWLRGARLFARAGALSALVLAGATHTV